MVMSALVDEMVDEVYTMLAYYGDSLEGLEFLIVNTEITDDHVLLSFKLKRRVQSLRRYAWDMRQLLQELRQNQYGVMPKQAMKLFKTIESNADCMVSIVEAYMLQCEGCVAQLSRHRLRRPIESCALRQTVFAAAAAAAVAADYHPPVPNRG